MFQDDRFHYEQYNNNIWDCPCFYGVKNGNIHNLVLIILGKILTLIVGTSFELKVPGSNCFSLFLDSREDMG